MKKLFALLIGAYLLAAVGVEAGEKKANPVNVPAGINHSGYDRLLKKYVDEKGLVAYGAWAKNPKDLAALDSYLKEFSTGGANAEGNEKAASLINAYNASTMQWILRNYPTESIWSLQHSFDAKRHRIGGREVSLNDIEKGTLVPQLGYKAHAVLVCAARSCPPLRRGAYTTGELDGQIDNAYIRWLSRSDLNEYHPNKNAVKVSSLFKWYKKDFDKAGGTPKILARYAPAADRAFLRKPGYEVKFKSYNWGLNDQGGHGRLYTAPQLLLDKLSKNS
ncbi:MAG: DUF547 domain-containing protein [Chthoniobacterales bacterium]|nr:DUF547 domain-containing protein [Chthoniobacterales bacterium]